MAASGCLGAVGSSGDASAERSATPGDAGSIENDGGTAPAVDASTSADAGSLDMNVGRDAGLRDAGALSRDAGSAPKTDGGIVPIDGTGDAFYAAVAAEPVNTWCSMAHSGTIVGPVQKLIDDGLYIDYTGKGAITEAYSGAAHDDATGIMAGAGGGHYDGNFNGSWVADLETGAFSIGTRPSLVTPAEKDAIVASWNANGGWLGWSQWGLWPSSVNADGRPGSIHTYNTLTILDNVLYFQDRAHDLKTGSISVLPYGPRNLPNSFSVRWGRKHLVFAPANDPFRMALLDYDLGTRTDAWLSYPYIPGQGGNINFSARTYGAVIGDSVYILKLDSDGSPQWVPPLAWRLDFSNLGETTFLTSGLKSAWSADDLAGVQQITYAFDDTENTLYIPARDFSYFLTWKPLTGECGKVVVANTPPPRKTNAAYGRFAFYKPRRTFVLVNSVDEPIYAIRLALTATP